MATLHAIDPESFIRQATHQPEHGRGAWTRAGIEFDYRYALSEDPAQRIGTRAQVSLDHWAVAAGSYAIQRRLMQLGFLAPLADSERGIFGPRTKAAVIGFQSASKDPGTGNALEVDGTVGTTDARALFVPLLRRAQSLYDIPNGLLLGETMHESSMDPGAVGYFIYYPEYRGVDRGVSQINCLYNPQVVWLEAYNAVTAFDWSGKRMRSFYDRFEHDYPKTPASALWDAAVCAHNNPSAATTWAKTGHAPSDVAQAYVDAVKASTF